MSLCLEYTPVAVLTILRKFFWYLESRVDSERASARLQKKMGSLWKVLSGETDWEAYRVLMSEKCTEFSRSVYRQDCSHTLLLLECKSCH